MKNFLKNKITTILIATATVMLAGVAIFTAIRIYSMRTRPVAPTAPESEPIAQVKTPTPSPTPTPTPQPTVTTFSPSPSPTPTPLPTNAFIAQATIAPTPTSLPVGSSQESTTTPTPTPTSSPQQTQTSTLPNAGIGLVSLIPLIAGTILIILTFILAF